MLIGRCTANCLTLASFASQASELSLTEPDSWPSSGRYATAVNAEKEETASKINEKVEKMSREMRTDKKFNDGNIRELEDAKVTPHPPRDSPLALASCLSVTRPRHDICQHSVAVFQIAQLAIRTTVKGD